MKLISLGFVSIVWLISFCCRPHLKSDTMETLELSLNNSHGFVISLESLGTAGYLWEPEVVDSSYVAIEKTDASVSPADRAAIGNSNRELFTLTAKQKGDTRIIFRQKRPWESGTEPLHTIVYQLHIVD